jgi:putative membrane protein (TIGR04086 family)
MKRNKNQKNKKNKERSILRTTAGDIIKGVVFAGVFTVFAILAFAFAIKAFSMESGPIPVVNQVIKMVGVFIAVWTATKKDKKPGIVKGIVAGVAYVVFGFLLMSLIGGEMGMLPVLLSDIAMGGVAGAIYALLLGLLRPKGKK